MEKSSKVSQNDGVFYFDARERQIHQSLASDHYHYKAYIGSHSFEIEAGDSAFIVDPEKNFASLARGPRKVESTCFAVAIRGYSPDERSMTFSRATTLPYVNGCSTKQIFAPERPGDPTLQLLCMPPNSSEQFHHIHSTARVVYVLEGEGTSVVGMNLSQRKQALLPGTVCVLDKMCPHHFETGAQTLLVLTVHVWSTVAGAEVSHPMYNGTFRVD